MVTADSLDTFADLTGKLAINQGGTPDSMCLVMYNLLTVLNLQGGLYVPESLDTEYSRWQKILLNQCGPEVPAALDAIADLIRKILTNQAGSLVPAALDNAYVSLQKIVDNGIALTTCYGPVGNNIVLIAGGNMLSISGNQLVLI